MTERLVVPFRRWHYEWLAQTQKAEGGIEVKVSDEIFRQLENANSWTGVIDGEPMVCAGTLAQWPGRTTAWAYVARGTGPHMRWVTAEVRRALDKVVGRIEFTVRKDFPAGQRWARTLGFRVESPLMEGYGPEGEPHVGFVRINK